MDLTKSILEAVGWAVDRFTWPGVILLLLCYAWWRIGRALGPHVPVVVAAYKLQAEAHAAQAEQMKAHSESLGTIVTEVKEVLEGVDEVKADVNEVKADVKTLMTRPAA